MFKLRFNIVSIFYYIKIIHDVKLSHIALELIYYYGF